MRKIRQTPQGSYISIELLAFSQVYINFHKILAQNSKICKGFLKNFSEIVELRAGPSKWLFYCNFCKFVHFMSALFNFEDCLQPILCKRLDVPPLGKAGGESVWEGEIDNIQT